MDIEIESLLFKQVNKPEHYLMTRSLSLFDNRYRVNVYVQFEEEGLIKKRIESSYFCHYNPGKLVIISEPDKNINKKRIFS